MSVQLADIVTLVRYLIDDPLASGSDVFTYGSSKIFTLTEGNASAVTDVTRNDSSSGVTYSFNSTSKKVTITSSLTAGDTVEIFYTYYSNYSDTEIQSQARSALMHLSANNYYTFTVSGSGNTIYPEPEDNQKNLIAMITAMIINPDNKTLRLPDITIQAPNDIPLHDKIRKIIAIFKKDVHGVFTII